MLRQSTGTVAWVVCVLTLAWDVAAQAPPAAPGAPAPDGGAPAQPAAATPADAGAPAEEAPAADSGEGPIAAPPPVESAAPPVTSVEPPVVVVEGDVTGPPTIVPEGAPVEGVEEIVVTAQRRKTNLQETPISITALSSDTLRERGAVDLTGVAEATPNMQLTTPRSSASTIRSASR